MANVPHNLLETSQLAVFPCKMGKGGGGEEAEHTVTVKIHAKQVVSNELFSVLSETNFGFLLTFSVLNKNEKGASHPNGNLLHYKTSYRAIHIPKE